MSLNKYLNLKTIYILASAHCLLLIFICGRQWYPDTTSYVAAWDTWSSFQIDQWRPPVYPLFIGIIKSIFGQEYYLLWVTIIQHIIFLISINFFYNLAKIIISDESISLWITAFYSIYPCAATWNCYVVTEPFAIYGMIFLLYNIAKAYKTESKKNLLGFLFWMLFLIFLRPAQMYILPVFFVGFCLLIFKTRKKKKVIIGGITSVLLTTFLLLLYSFYYHDNYGIFSPSGIGIINKYYIGRLDGIIKPECTNNPGLKEYVVKAIQKNGQQFHDGTDHDLYMEAEGAIYTYGLKDVSELISNSEGNNPKLLFRRFAQRLHKSANDKLFVTLNHTWNNVTDFIGIRFNILYIILFIYPLILLHWMLKSSRIAWNSILLYMLAFSHLFVIIFACQNVWDRLILPAIPCYLLIIGQLFAHYNISINRKHDFT